jgi:hypothetical protein
VSKKVRPQFTNFGGDSQFHASDYTDTQAPSPTQDTPGSPESDHSQTPIGDDKDVDYVPNADDETELVAYSVKPKCLRPFPRRTTRD